MKKIIFATLLLLLIVILSFFPYDTDNAGKTVSLLNNEGLTNIYCEGIDGGIGLKAVPFGVTATTCDTKYYFLFGTYLVKTTEIKSDFADNYTNFDENCKEIWTAQCLGIELVENVETDDNTITGVECIEPDCATVLSEYSWNTYSEKTGKDGLWDISFEYPNGYYVQSGGTDTFTDYDIIKDGDDQPRLSIIVSYNDEKSESLLNSLSTHTTSDDGVTIMFTYIGDNNIYAANSDALYHVAGFSSLDSDPFSAYIIDKNPTDNIILLQHVYQTLQIISK